MTADLDQERQPLILADRHLAAGEQRVAGQIALIRRMTAKGSDPAAARDLLRLLDEAMVLWQGHCLLIPDDIARHEQAISLPRETGPGPEDP